jgi:hypothetical protein
VRANVHSGVTTRRNSGVTLPSTASVKKRKYGRKFAKFASKICQENVTRVRRDENLSFRNPTLTDNLKSTSK